MTNGGEKHDGRNGKKKSGGKKGKPKDPTAELKRKNLLPPALAGKKTR
jgi:hypothetical protein